MQLVLMNNDNNLHDRPISAGAAAAAAAQAAANLNSVLASGTSASEHNNDSNANDLNATTTSTPSSENQVGSTSTTNFTTGIDTANTTTTAGTSATSNNTSSNNYPKLELPVPYQYKDYSTVTDLDGVEGYSAKNASNPQQQAAVAAANMTAAPAASAIHDAHTMRLQKFPAKLESILSRPEWSDIVTWMPHGRSWKILKPHDFETLIMPLYFDHCNYHSFNRLVNAWSFRRMSSGPDRGSYYHELFLRGRPNLHKLMRRLPKSQKKAPMSKQDEPDFYSMPKMDALVPSNNPGTSPAALAAAAGMPSSMSAKSAAAQAMAAAAGGMGMNNLGNMNMAALTSGFGGNLAAATNDVGQLSLMGLHQGMGMSMFGNHNGLLGMDNNNNNNNNNANTSADSTNSTEMGSNSAIQAAMARIAQQQLAERAQMSSLLGMGFNDASNMFQQQTPSLMSNDLSKHENQSNQQDQLQDTTPSLEANLRATQMEHDRLQQQIAALQAQQQAIANEQLQLQQFQQQQAAVVSAQQMQQANHLTQLNEASFQAQQESNKMASPILGGANASVDAGTITQQVANSPAAKSG